MFNQEKPSLPSLLKGKEREKHVNKITDDYLEFFDEKDSTKSGNLRQNNTKDMVKGYYDVATDFYEYGWGESFHFYTIRKGESRELSCAKHEYKLAIKLELKPGDKVMDCGCGIGGPARHISEISGAHITGVNINKYQLERARTLTQNANLQDQCNFQERDFCNTKFDDCFFDKVYSIEATCHCAELKNVLQEIYRVLKPGGLFAFYDWILTAKYDPNNDFHKKIKHEIMEGDALPDIRYADDITNTCKQVGFEILEATDLSGLGDMPWYSVLTNKSGITDLKSSALGRWLTHTSLVGMEAIGLAPKGSTKVHKMLCKGADGLVKGGQEGIFSPMYLIVARKPLK